MPTTERTTSSSKKRPAKANGAAASAKAAAKRAAVKVARAVKKTASKAVSKTKAATKTVSKSRAADRAAKERMKRMAPPLETLARLRKMYPDAHCELDHDGPFQLLVATVLSAQTTDVNVNKATPKLFARWPDAKSLATADPKEVEPYIASLGFFRQKAKSIVGLAKKLVERHGGEVPNRMEDLVELPGVGRKTANVVLGVIWNAPEGVVVDTHVQRIAQRLGWTANVEPEKIEQDLCRLIPRDQWDMTSHLLIFHGRRTCFAKKPNCEGCALNDICPSAFDAENVGRKKR